MRGNASVTTDSLLVPMKRLKPELMLRLLARMLFRTAVSIRANVLCSSDCITNGCSMAFQTRANQLYIIVPFEGVVFQDGTGGYRD